MTYVTETHEHMLVLNRQGRQERRFSVGPAAVFLVSLAAILFKQVLKGEWVIAKIGRY